MHTLSLLLLVITLGSTARCAFNAIQHAGGESPWFPASEQYGISAVLPDGCTVDQAAYITRHGS
jgi:acid phosphatase